MAAAAWKADMRELNSQTDLHPIGTIVESIFEPEESSTGAEPRYTIWKYRVIGHVLLPVWPWGSRRPEKYKDAPVYWQVTTETLETRYEKARVVWNPSTGKTSYERMEPE